MLFNAVLRFIYNVARVKAEPREHDWLDFSGNVLLY